MKRDLFVGAVALTVGAFLIGELLGGRGRGGGGGGRAGGGRPAGGGGSIGGSRPAVGGGGVSRPAVGGGGGARVGDRGAGLGTGGPAIGGGGARPGGAPGIGGGPGVGTRPSQGDLGKFLDMGSPGAGSGVGARPGVGGGPGVVPGGGGAVGDFFRGPGAGGPGVGAPGVGKGGPGVGKGGPGIGKGGPGVGKAGQLPSNRPTRIENRPQNAQNRQERRQEVRDQFRDNHPRFDFATDHPRWARWRVNAPYRWATVAALSGWCGYGAATYYDWGENIYYQDGSVYSEGEVVATAERYDETAEKYATSIPPVMDPEWMPLGVFAITKDGEASGPAPTLFLQLNVSKEGIIAGSLQNTALGTSQPIEGMVDKNSQRAAWVVSGTKRPLMEVGIFNLTKDTAPALVHYEDVQVQQFLLIRMDEPKK